jgi:hypothetical protein
MDRINNGMLTALFYVPGTHTECLYSLMTFGIPMSDFPMTDDGLELNRKKHHKWIEMRRKVEARRGKEGFMKVVLLPSHSDVLFGRGTPTQNHRGNVNLSLLVEKYLLRYNECSFRGKTALAQEIISNIKSRGGHFLKQVDGIWEEVDDKVAQGKVSHTIRNVRIVKKTAQDKQSAVGIKEEVIKKRPYGD